jgi:glycosyltransferase involved in cell wall biosynthesis
MVHSKRIVLTVTNDLNYDQRMQRICTSLAEAGHVVTLVGRALPHTLPLAERPYEQVRLRCWRHKGFAFYAEYNLRLLLFLLRARLDVVCSIDLDTLPAGCIATVLRGKARVFDAHEHFTEVPEVVGRPVVQAFWGMVARIFLPFYKNAYTVGPALAGIFAKKYGIPFKVVRNVPLPRPMAPALHPNGKKILLYQGALNDGRGIEALIDAISLLPDHFELWLAGEGDLSAALRARAEALDLGQRVRFLGYLRPEQLHETTPQAWLGLNLLENKGLSYYYSLANKYFDFVQAGIPVLTMNFPEYQNLQQTHEVACLLDHLDTEHLSNTILALDKDQQRYAFLQKNCQKAASEWQWEREKEVLLRVYANI